MTIRVTKRPGFAAFSRAYVDELDERMSEVAEEVARRAKRKAPVDEGRLRSAIRIEHVGDAAYEVVAGVDYAEFQEMGTGVAGAASPQPGGIPEGYEHGPSAGMKAQSYLRPAVIEVDELLLREGKIFQHTTKVTIS